MSWYDTVVLSFGCDEFDDDDDESNQDCEPLRRINSKRRRFEPLTNLNSYDNGALESNAVLFGGCYDYLDVEGFYDCVQRQKWRAIDDVQFLHWDDNASKFEVDFESAQLLSRSATPLDDAVCFHAQRCLEKYLKAWLQEVNIRFPRRHDLEELLNLAIPIEPAWNSWRPDFLILTSHAVELRFPGKSATVEEAQHALQVCAKVRIQIRQAMGFTS